ncbi:MAG: hypothetical protein RSA70_06525, partial [Clostridia bacterium]
MKENRIYDIPPSRDPFANASLVRAGNDADTGHERFWDSTWNSHSGAIGVLVSPQDDARVYRFDPKRAEFGFYGARYGGDDIMWMSGFLDEVIALDLKTGETTHYPTGLPHALSSAGFCFDETTGKILSSTFCQVDHTRKAFIFDTNTRKIVKRFQNLPVSGNQLAASIRLRDGSFLGAYVVPKLELVRWYPERDEIEIVSGALSLDEIEWSYTLTARADGAVYIPQHGWFNPQENCIAAGALAPSEATWFGTRGTKMYGLECTRGGNAILREWDTESGSVRAIYEIPDCGSSACCMTRDGQIACIGRYGHFIIIEPDSGALLRRETLESDSVGELDCIYRADNNTLIATPFITQRFLQIDMKSGRGYDMGRANNG